jgi:phosphate acyltransferase
MSTSVRIAVDAVGGDHAPQLVLDGVRDAVELWSDIDIFLVGPEAFLKAEAHKRGLAACKRISYIHAPDAVLMGEAPVRALRRKPNCSINVAARAMSDSLVEAIFSAGPTGATITAVCFSSQMLEAVRRPGIAVSFPSSKRPVVLCDVGANVACKPIHLLQYGIMASEFCKFIHGVAKPRVSLLNIGEEESKGNLLVRQSHALLRSCSEINYAGLIEGHGVMAGDADVVVCDGFTGNIVLKIAEGVAELLSRRFLSAAKDIDRSLHEQLSASMTGMSDYSSYGGAPLLGVDGCTIIGHGRSDARAIRNGIGVARDFARRRINGHIVEKLRSAADKG